MASTAIVHTELSYRVVGCAQRVHAELGPGFPEAVYQKALGHELAKSQIPFQSQARFEVAYDGVLCGEFRVDVDVDDKVIIEIKAVETLCREHVAQLLAYLKASGRELGLFMNFGEASLRVQRLANTLGRRGPKQDPRHSP